MSLSFAAQLDNWQRYGSNGAVKTDKSADVARAAYGSTSDFGMKLSSADKMNLFKKISGKDMYLGSTLQGGARDKYINDMYDWVLRGALDTKDLSDEEAYKYGPETPGGHWASRLNKITGETEVIDDRKNDENNLWRKYKKPLIQLGGGVLGFLVGGPAGAMAGANLAGTVRDAYAARVDRRKIQDYKRDWENDPRNQPWEPTSGNLYQSAGEGVVNYATKDLEKKRKQAYVEGQQPQGATA